MFYDYPNVKLTVDKSKCIKCNACISICMDFLEKDADGYPCQKNISEMSWGCVRCGSCMMKCPVGAISVEGDGVSRENLRNYPSDIASFESLKGLLFQRRSCRSYKQENVSSEDIQKILNLTATAPLVAPPNETKVLVINGTEKVQDFAKDIIISMRDSLKFMNPFILSLLKIFVSGKMYSFISKFLLPLLKRNVSDFDNGKDSLFYNAPVLIIFYQDSPFDDTEMIINQSFACISIESMGYSSCFIGSVAPILNRSNNLKEKYGLKKTDKVGGALILGKARDKNFKHVCQRKFKDVKFF